MQTSNTPSLSRLLLSDLGQLSVDLLKVAAVIKVCSLAVKGLSYMTDEAKMDKKLEERKVVQQSSSGFRFYDLVGLVHLL